MALTPTTSRRSGWWREAIIYQVWPKSFYSANGGRTGDINGIVAKLDYITNLGCNTIWLSPHYKSPMVDEGYDIADYTNINPDFGTRADAERLIKECHARGLRIIFDLVINHTSDQHKWFEESRSSRDNPKRDWYIWRPAKYDKDGHRQPPNNWMSWFSQSAWTWDEKTQEYYLHLFAIEQPDLNWTNEDCRKAIYQDAMEFWLERGVNGFRVDTVTMYSKPMDFPDAPVTIPNSRWQPAAELFCNGPEMAKYLNEMGEILERYDAMTVGEAPCTDDPTHVLDYVSFQRNALSMVFQFDLADLGKKPNDLLGYGGWKLADMKRIADKWQRFIEGNDGWTTSFMENHDQGRSVSRFASDKPAHRQVSAKMLALLLLCSSGTPYVYMGEELGMTNMPGSWDLSEYLDLNTINYVERLRQEGASDEDVKKAMPGINLLARDNCRTPLQWSGDDANGGFTKEGVKPWMRVNDNYKEINAAQQIYDPLSVYGFYQRAIALRKANKPLFTFGSFQLHDAPNPNVFAFVKTANTADGSVKETGKSHALVLLNFTDAAQPAPLPENLDKASAHVALSSYEDTPEVGAELRPYEGRVLLY